MQVYSLPVLFFYIFDILLLNLYKDVNSRDVFFFGFLSCYSNHFILKKNNLSGKYSIKIKNNPPCPDNFLPITSVWQFDLLNPQLGRLRDTSKNMQLHSFSIFNSIWDWLHLQPKNRLPQQQQQTKIKAEQRQCHAAKPLSSSVSLLSAIYFRQISMFRSVFFFFFFCCWHHKRRPFRTALFFHPTPATITLPEHPTYHPPMLSTQQQHSHTRHVYWLWLSGLSEFKFALCQRSGAKKKQQTRSNRDAPIKKAPTQTRKHRGWKLDWMTDRTRERVGQTDAK